MTVGATIELAVSLAWDFSQFTPADIFERLPVALVAEMLLERRRRLGITEDKNNDAAAVALRRRLTQNMTDGN